jgi:hypothetical protein
MHLSYTPGILPHMLQHTVGYYNAQYGATSYLVDTGNRYIYYHAYNQQYSWWGSYVRNVPSGGTGSCTARSMRQVDLGTSFRDYTLTLTCS